jgi:hypothetical protein
MDLSRGVMIERQPTAPPVMPVAAKKCGLRFERSEIRKLRRIADRAKVNDLQADVSAFEDAARAAELGEPLIVFFETEEEILKLVAGYVLHGIKQPVIEELSD